LNQLILNYNLEDASLYIYPFMVVFD